MLFVRPRAAALAATLTASAMLAAGPMDVTLAASPGAPGVTEPGSLVYYEDFSNGTNPATTTPITEYVGGSAAQFTPYTADPYWASEPNCNGFIETPQSVNSTACPAQVFSQLKAMAAAITTFNGLTGAAANTQSVLAEMTNGSGPPVGQTVMLKSASNNIPMTAGHFYNISAIFAVKAYSHDGPTCASYNTTSPSGTPSLDFSLLDGTTKIPLSTGLNVCTAPGSTYYTASNSRVANVVSRALRWTGGATAGILLENTSRGSSNGNDAAFASPMVTDVTPQLDKSFTPGTITAGEDANLVYTVTNTNELGAKNGWSFTDDLPSGLTATGTTSSTCPGAMVTAGSGSTEVAGTGNLDAGETSCTITVQVTSSTAGRIVNGPGNFPAGTAGLDGLNAPGDAVLNVVPPTSLVIQKSSTVTAITSVGQQVPYTFQVTNRSAEPISDIQVTDQQTAPSLDGDLSAIRCPVTMLGVGDSERCTATYTVTAADLAAGRIQDTATASGSAPNGDAVTSLPSSLTITEPQPAVTIAKSSTTTLVDTVGQQVTYRFRVTNSGNQTLTGIVVSDAVAAPSDPANLGAVDCPVDTVAAGATIECTTTYTTTQADLDAGAVSDTGHATGDTPGGATARSNDSSVTIGVTPDSRLTILKSSTATSVTAAGQVVPFTFTVTNTGSQTLTGVTVTDTVAAPSDPGNLGALVCPTTTLPPGATATCATTYTTTQADMDSGTISDTATATATDPSGRPVASAPSQLVIDVDQRSSESLVKSATSSAPSSDSLKVGQTVTYTFVVSNTGNTTVTHLAIDETSFTGHGSPPTVTCLQTELAPGRQAICSTSAYTIVEADVAAGRVDNTAVAIATPPEGAPISSAPSSFGVPFIPAPSLALVKSVTPTTLSAAGQVAQYDFEVTNDGNVPVEGLAVDEVAFSGTGAPLDITCPDTSLVPGQRTTCESSYAVTQADVDALVVTNTAVAIATSQETTHALVTSNHSSALLTALDERGLTLQKTVTPDTAHAAGDRVTYEYALSNLGDTELSLPVVTEISFTGTGSLPRPDCPSTIGPRETVYCTATYAVTQADVDAGTVSNTATAAAEGPTGALVSNPSTTTLTLPHADALTLEKTVERQGSTAAYRYTVSNTGNTTISDITVAEATFTGTGPAPVPDCPGGSLQPGAATTCTADYRLTAADLAAGFVSNTATVSGLGPGASELVSGRSTAVVATTAEAEITEPAATAPAALADTGDAVPATLTLAALAFLGTGTAIILRRSRRSRRRPAAQRGPGGRTVDV